MKTFIVDLFHPAPEEIGDEAATHDIVGTSEPGVAFSQYYGNHFRLYYCEDVDQELKVKAWHENDGVSRRLNLKLNDINDIDGIPSDIIGDKTTVRVIINGQGFISDSTEHCDTIGGLNSAEFMATLESILQKLKINKDHHKMVELVISSCRMSRSADFVSALNRYFCDYDNELRVILFPEVLSFNSRGEFVFFLDNHTHKVQRLETLTPDMALTLACGQNSENMLKRKTPICIKFRTQERPPYISSAQQGQGAKRMVIDTGF